MSITKGCRDLVRLGYVLKGAVGAVITFCGSSATKEIIHLARARVIKMVA